MSEWARPAGDLEVFATGDSLLLAPRDDEPSAIAEFVRRTGGDYHARPGFRPGVRIATTSGRRSGDADVVRPMLVDPRRACEAAIDGTLFARPIAGLELAPHDRRPGERELLVWNARLSGEHVRAVPVTINLLASPSMVVTIVELVPQRRVRWNRTGFLTDGVAAVEQVATRLAALA